MRRSLFLAGSTAVVALAAIAAILTVGGPITGRHEKFDRYRLNDIKAISVTLHCDRREESHPPLPAELTSEVLAKHCDGSGDRLVDRETGKPYVYTKISDNEFSICAELHDAERIVRLTGGNERIRGSFDVETGCITGRIQ